MSWRDTAVKITDNTPKKSGKSWRDTAVNVETGEPAYSDTVADTVMDALVSAPQGITTWSDEAAAGILAGLEKGGGSPEEMSALFEKYREPIGQRLALARKRSPVASTSAEIGTGIASTLIPGTNVGKVGNLWSSIGRGAFEGLGASEDKLSGEGAAMAGLGGAIGGIGSLVSGGLKKITSSNPDVIRANVLGARTSEFKEIGIKEREKIARDLKDIGLFSNIKVKFDPKELKFKKVGTALENLQKPLKDKLETRIQDAMSTSQQEKLKVLGAKINDTVDLNEIEKSLDSVVKNFSRKGSGMAERVLEAEAVKEEILNDILSDMQDSGLLNTTVGLIEKAKQRLHENVGTYGKNPLLAKTPNQAQIYQNMYTAINNKLRDLVGDVKYKQINELQQKLYTVSADLAKAQASEDAARAGVSYGGILNRAANAVLGGDETQLSLAKAADVANLPGLKQLQPAAILGTSEAPYAAIRHLRSDIPKEPIIPYAPEQEPATPPGYNFQNVKPAFPMGVPPKGTFINPKQLIKYRIPRSSEGILQNKEMVLAKIAQAGVPSGMYDTIAYALNENPQKIKDVAPVIMMQFPMLFEDSPYAIFDNKIIDPNDRARMADSLSKDDTLNSIQKARMISRINKTGEVPKVG